MRSISSKTPVSTETRDTSLRYVFTPEAIILTRIEYDKNRNTSCPFLSLFSCSFAYIKPFLVSAWLPFHPIDFIAGVETPVSGKQEEKLAKYLSREFSTRFLESSSLCYMCGFTKVYAYRIMCGVQSRIPTNYKQQIPFVQKLGKLDRSNPDREMGLQLAKSPMPNLNKAGVLPFWLEIEEGSEQIPRKGKQKVMLMGKVK